VKTNLIDPLKKGRYRSKGHQFTELNQIELENGQGFIEKNLVKNPQLVEFINYSQTIHRNQQKRKVTIYALTTTLLVVLVCLSLFYAWSAVKFEESALAEAQKSKSSEVMAKKAETIAKMAESEAIDAKEKMIKEIDAAEEARDEAEYSLAMSYYSTFLQMKQKKLILNAQYYALKAFEILRENKQVRKSELLKLIDEIYSFRNPLIKYSNFELMKAGDASNNGQYHLTHWEEEVLIKDAYSGEEICTLPTGGKGLATFSLGGNLFFIESGFPEDRWSVEPYDLLLKFYNVKTCEEIASHELEGVGSDWRSGENSNNRILTFANSNLFEAKAKVYAIDLTTGEKISAAVEEKFVTIERLVFGSRYLLFNGYDGINSLKYNTGRRYTLDLQTGEVVKRIENNHKTTNEEPNIIYSRDFSRAVLFGHEDFIFFDFESGIQIDYQEEVIAIKGVNSVSFCNSGVVKVETVSDEYEIRPNKKIGQYEIVRVDRSCNNDLQTDLSNNYNQSHRERSAFNLANSYGLPVQAFSFTAIKYVTIDGVQYLYTQWQDSTSYLWNTAVSENKKIELKISFKLSEYAVSGNIFIAKGHEDVEFPSQPIYMFWNLDTQELLHSYKWVKDSKMIDEIPAELLTATKGTLEQIDSGHAPEFIDNEPERIPDNCKELTQKLSLLAKCSDEGRVIITYAKPFRNASHYVATVWITDHLEAILEGNITQRLKKPFIDAHDKDYL
jgi:hypothetical protein